jgi:hypothetical protein
LVGGRLGGSKMPEDVTGWSIIALCYPIYVYEPNPTILRYSPTTASTFIAPVVVVA